MKIRIPELKIDLNLSLVFILVSILVVPFIYSTSVPDPSLSPRLLALNIAVLIFGIVLLIHLWIKPQQFDLSIFRDNIIKFYFAYVLIAGISVFFATNQSEAIFEWFKVFSFFVYFLLLTIILTSSKNYLSIVLKTIAVFSILISLRGFYEILNVASVSNFDHQSSYFIRAFSSNRNLYSQILFLCMPFTLFGIYKLNSFWKVLSIVGSVLCFLLVIILLTRSVWIAFLISTIICYSFLFLNRKSFSISKKSSRILVVIPVVAMLLIIIGIFAYSRIGNIEVFKKQTFWVQNYKFGSSLERVDLWEKTIKMSVDNPLIGVGQGNWRIEFPKQGLGDLRSETGEVFFQRPHNDILWVLSENGIFGMICYLMLFGLTFYYLFRIIKISAIPEKKYLALAMIFGLSGYIIISLFSFPKERIEHQVFLLLIFAISVIEYHSENSKIQRQKKGQAIIVLLAALTIIAVGSYLSFNRFNSEKHISKAYNFRAEENWQNEIKEYQLAESITTKIDAFSTPLAWYIGEAFFNLNNLDSAHFYFRKALKFNPNHLHVLNNLGTTFELKGNSDEAERYFLQAHQISPGFEDPLFNLCALYYNRKDYNLAYNTIRKVDIESVNPKYDKYLNAILWNITDEFSKSFPNQELSKSVIRIRNSSDWMIKVHEQSINDEAEFERQLLLEVIYLLESVDSTINSVEAEKYRNDFNLPKI